MRLRQFTKLFSTRTMSNRHLLALLFLTVLVLTAFPTWILPGQLGMDDLSHLNAPQRMLLPWFYLHGQWPLWNPYSFAGQPFLAAGQSGPLYLPNIVFLLLPISPALKLSYLLHELLAAVGMYLAVWHLGRRYIAAITASVAFATSGFLVGHLIHTQMFDAMTWLPLLFWLALRVLERPVRSRTAWLAAAFALEIYAGHPQITFFVLLTLALYGLLHGLQNRHWSAWKGILAVAGGLILGGILASAQWLPTLNLVGYSNRSNTASEFLLNGSWPGAGLVQFLVPFSAGGGYTGQPFSQQLYSQLFHSDLYWEYTAYAGVFSVVVGSAVSMRNFFRSEPTRNAVVIGILAIWLAFGSNGQLGSFLVHTPGFDLFRIPARYVGIADFSIALLFGLALAALQNEAHSGRLRLSIGLSGLIYLFLLIAARQLGPLHDSPARAFWVPAGLIAFVTVASFLTPWLSTPRLVMAISLLSLTDGVFQSAMMSKLTLVVNASYTHPSGAIRFLQQHLSPNQPFSRVAALSDTSSLYLDMAAAYRIPALNGYDSLMPDWYTKYIALTWDANELLMQPRSLLDALGVKYIATYAHGSPFLPTKTIGIQSYVHVVPSLPQGLVTLHLRVGSVVQPHGTATIARYGPLFSVTLKSGQRAHTYLVSGGNATEYMVPLPANWPRNSPTQVILQNESWTRLTLINNLWFADSRNKTIGSVSIEKIFGPRALPVVYQSKQEEILQNPDSTSPAWVAPSTSGALIRNGQATLQTWSANRQQWAVQSTHGGVFVLSQMYDPNWHATVDGKPTSITIANHVLTGVPVPPGRHQITLVYAPQSFTWGLAASAFALLFWLSLLLLPKRRKSQSI